MNWIDIGGITDIPRRGARCVDTPRRQDRRVPHRRRRGLRHRGPLPAQGRAAEPGHRPRRGGHLPAAQLGDLARNRQGAGRRRGLRAHDRRCKVEDGTLFIAARALLRIGAPEHGHAGASAASRPPAPIAASAAACSPRSRPTATSRSRGDPDHPANFGRLCSKGSALARRSTRRPAAASARSAAGARTGTRRSISSPARSPRRSPSTARTPSPSTSRASC